MSSEVRTSLVAEVAVAAPIGTPLSYLLPEALVERARVGVRLQVPLGRRRVVGYLLSISEQEKGEGEGGKLRAVEEVLDESPLFFDTMIPLFRRAAEYYRHPIGEVIRTALPAGLSGRGAGVRILTEKIYRAAPGEDFPAGAKQKEILLFLRLKESASLEEIRERFDSPHAPLKRLVELGLLLESTVEKQRDPFLAMAVPPDVDVEPGEDQADALASILEGLSGGGFTPHLLHGVTGSGKTEVYLRSIAAALELGRKALVLVPEIALTPQAVGRFRARFGGRANIAVLHSGLSDGERYDAWRAIARGEVDIVIGARSAVFAPVRELGIIVIDEEHESSYKQGEGFRYHARDLALLRGQMAGATVLLGSATPALTSFHRAMAGHIGYLHLSGRALSRRLPEVELVDLTKTPFKEALSEKLVEAVRETLGKAEQVLLLLNRRGFSPYLLCSDCGATFRCPNCEITLTYHQARRQLCCHYCDYTDTPADICPTCSGGKILPEGMGTERLEEELAALFPEARIARMDRDTMTAKGAHDRIVGRMEAGEIDILVGTQMVAKGHDFPGVTLVGVVNADSTLNFPDFRSAERTFALLTQVAGRAGRGDRPGRVLIQTYSSDHYALLCAADHDYRKFYDQEILFRRELGYPPFGFLVNLVLSGNESGLVAAAAASLAAGLQRGGGEVEILGPAPCPLAKLRGKTRMQILLKAAERPPLRRQLARLGVLEKRIPAMVRLSVDVDPVDML